MRRHPALDRRFWHWERRRYPILYYRELRYRGFGRVYAFILAVGFDGVGT